MSFSTTLSPGQVWQLRPQSEETLSGQILPPTSDSTPTKLSFVSSDKNWQKTATINFFLRYRATAVGGDLVAIRLLRSRRDLPVDIRNRDSESFSFRSMADFKTHISTSTMCGIGLGSAAYFGSHYPLDQCLVATGLCSVAGMFPDFDSDNGVPVRELFAFAAAVVPMLMIHRFQHMGMSAEQMVLIGMSIYVGIRFGVSRVFKRFTVHRGMWHSIPAALLIASFTFLISTSEDVKIRMFKALAVFIGFCSHLVLDEIYSIDMSGRRIRLKKSTGTAMKMWGGSAVANFVVYFLLFGVITTIAYDESLMEAMGYDPIRIPHTAQEWFDGIMNRAKDKFSNRGDSQFGLPITTETGFSQ